MDETKFLKNSFVDYVLKNIQSILGLRPTVNMTLIPLLSHPVLRPKLNAFPLCVSGSCFTQKPTNSEINSITSVYYIESYYKSLLQVQKGLNSGKGHNATGR
jgi:hypothetical protein